MVAIKEDRERIKLYKKKEACKEEGILTKDFDRCKDKFIPIEYSTPQNKKYAKSAGVRYIRVEELNNFIKKYLG